MTFEIGFVLAVAVCAVILFATEKLSVDVVAVVVMATLIASGIVSAEEGLSGFSNSATVTVAAMFILSAGLFKTGAVNYLGDITSKLFKRNLWLGLISVMFAVAFFSAFINNTPVVAIFIPILLGVAKEIKASTSKLLMPMSFASMFGGVCTLIGTSTNILVNSMATKQGQPPFSMFEIAPLGLAMFVVGTTYMLVIGIRLIPERRAEGDLIESFRLREYITEVVLLETSSSVGKQIKDAPLVKEIDINIIEIQRGEDTIPLPAATEVLKAGDILRVRCDLDKFKKIHQRQGVIFKPEIGWRDEDIQSFDAKLVEGVIAPHSEFIGKTLKDLNFREEFGATVLALRHRGVLMREKLSETKLDAGDALLLEVRKRRYNQLRQNSAFVIISEVEQEKFRKSKIIPAIAIIAAVILTASSGYMDIVSAAVIGSILMVLVGCIRMQEAYKAIEWRIIFLLAGVLALEAAMVNSKAGDLISHQIISTVGVWGPIAMVSAFYLMTFVLTEMMSNTATAALLTPVAIATANQLGVNPRPFLVAVMFAASASFMTPVGYQTNTLIYGPGQYRFADFLKVGTPLNFLFWITATILIPVIWPFEPMP